MTTDQITLFALLGVFFALLIWGRIRYDVVAFGALVVAVVLGAVDQKAAFAGFGHPAVIIIALVLVVSRGLVNSGAIEVIARHAIDRSRSVSTHANGMPMPEMAARRRNAGLHGATTSTELDRAVPRKGRAERRPPSVGTPSPRDF